MKSEAQDCTAYESYDFSLKAVMVFNPEAIPENPKPSEQDIQDAKLLFYHPAISNIEEKRNQVGLAEGFFVFCDSFQAQSEAPYPKYHSIHLSEQTHVIVQVAAKLYVFFSFSHSAFPKYKSGEEYYDPDCHQQVFGSDQDLYINVCQNFIQCFQLWHGDFAKMTIALPAFIPTWIHCYARPSPTIQQQLNFLTFQHQQFRYAPIDAQLFLTLQYLISMLRQIEPNLVEITIFYQGYFIYSSLQHKHSVLLKDHYYGAGVPWAIAEQKLQTKFKQHDVNEQSCAFMHFCNLRNCQWDNILPQKIYLQNQLGILTEYNYFTFLERGLLMLMAFGPSQQFSRLRDIQICIQRNCDKISQRLDQFLDTTNAKPDALRIHILQWHESCIQSFQQYLTWKDFPRKSQDFIINQ